MRNDQGDRVPVFSLPGNAEPFPMTEEERLNHEAAEAAHKQTLDRQATEQALAFGRFLQSFDAIFQPTRSETR